MMNAIAAGGTYRAPCFLERVFSESTGETVKRLDTVQARTACSPKTAAALCAMLTAVVEQGIGGEAKPAYSTAAGKTGTAQTGRYDENGKEYKDLWFAGFYPAQQPQYTIVVMQDDQITAKYSSAAIFSRVCDALYLLEGETAQQAENS